MLKGVRPDAYLVLLNWEQSFQHTGNLGRSLGASVSPSRVFLDAQQHNSKKEAYQTGAHRWVLRFALGSRAGPGRVVRPHGRSRAWAPLSNVRETHTPAMQLERGCMHPCAVLRHPRRRPCLARPAPLRTHPHAQAL